MHAPAVATLQDPSAAQHAPVGSGQVTDAQLVPSPWYEPEHVALVSSVQLPLVAQQAPDAAGAV